MKLYTVHLKLEDHCRLIIGEVLCGPVTLCTQPKHTGPIGKPRGLTETFRCLFNILKKSICTQNRGNEDSILEPAKLSSKYLVVGPVSSVSSASARYSEHETTPMRFTTDSVTSPTRARLKFACCRMSRFCFVAVIQEDRLFPKWCGLVSLSHWAFFSILQFYCKPRCATWIFPWWAPRFVAFMCRNKKQKIKKEKQDEYKIGRQSWQGKRGQIGILVLQWELEIQNVMLVLSCYVTFLWLHL